MTNIEEGNKLIFDFDDNAYWQDVEDGGKIRIVHGGVFPDSKLQYHSSWDWLMPVVEKIEGMQTDVDGYFGVYISSNSCTIQGTKFRSDDKYCKAYFSDHYGETKIEATWQACVQFIKWYNENK